MRLKVAALLACAIAAEAQSPDNADRALREFQLTRALLIEAPDQARLRFLSAPARQQADTAGSRAHPNALWQGFFAGALLAVGQSNAPRPLALHYNALADVAIVQGCSSGGDAQLACQSFCALPGEVLMGMQVPAPAVAWVGSASILRTLVDTTRARVVAFRAALPPAPPTEDEWTRRYCRVDWHRAAESRLVAAMLARETIDQAMLGRAIGSFLKSHGSDAKRPPGADSTIGRLLRHFDQFNLAGTLALPGEGQIIFFAPKRSGWYLVALLYGPQSVDGAIVPRLLDATLLSLATNRS